MRPIDADALMKTVFNDVVLVDGEVRGVGLILAETVDKAPTIDAVPVVRCDSCVLEGHCVAESYFKFAGIENPFCCAGKLLKLSDTERKCDD